MVGIPVSDLRDRLAEIIYEAERLPALPLSVRLEIADALLASEEWQAREQAIGLLRLIADEALGNPGDEYASVPTQYVHEAARLAAVRGEGGPAPEKISCACAGACHMRPEPCSLSCIAHHAAVRRAT